MSLCHLKMYASTICPNAHRAMSAVVAGVYCRHRGNIRSHRLVLHQPRPAADPVAASHQPHLKALAVAYPCLLASPSPQLKREPLRSQQLLQPAPPVAQQLGSVRRLSKHQAHQKCRLQPLHHHKLLHLCSSNPPARQMLPSRHQTAASRKLLGKQSSLACLRVWEGWASCWARCQGLLHHPEVCVHICMPKGLLPDDHKLVPCDAVFCHIASTCNLFVQGAECFMQVGKSCEITICPLLPRLVACWLFGAHSNYAVGHETSGIQFESMPNACP